MTVQPRDLPRSPVNSWYVKNVATITRIFFKMHRFRIIALALLFCLVATSFASHHRSSSKKSKNSDRQEGEYSNGACPCADRRRRDASYEFRQNGQAWGEERLTTLDQEAWREDYGGSDKFPTGTKSSRRNADWRDEYTPQQGAYSKRETKAKKYEKSRTFPRESNGESRYSSEFPPCARYSSECPKSNSCERSTRSPQQPSKVEPTEESSGTSYPECQKYIGNPHKLSKCERKASAARSHLTGEKTAPEPPANVPECQRTSRVEPEEPSAHAHDQSSSPLLIHCQKYAYDPYKFAKCESKAKYWGSILSQDFHQEASEEQPGTHPQCQMFAYDPYKLAKCEYKLRKYTSCPYLQL